MMTTDRNTPARHDIFAPTARVKLGANHTGSNSFRMGIAIQSTLGHVFAGIDNHLDPEHKAARKAERRAAGKRQRVARRKSRA